MRIVVVLPAPFGPRNPTILPGTTLKLAPSSATTLPYRFDRSRKFSTWIYTIASNLAKNELRNRSRNPLVLFQTIRRNWEDDDRPLQFEDFGSRPDDLYRKRYLQKIVEQTVEELPEHHKLVFRLRELEGKSYEEIADITGVNLGTVKSRLHRARTSFAERIEPLLN